MEINIDTVYQKVLALANKEQRGYITPQEFNLLADQAQMEIFEQYFYDQNQADRNLKNSTELSNVDEILDEKISIHKKLGTITMSGNVGTLPGDVYRLGTVFLASSQIELEQLIEKNKSLEAQLKEKDLQIEQEVLYKMEERKKWEALSNEINQIKKQLGFYIAFNKTGKAKVLDLVKDILKI